MRIKIFALAVACLFATNCNRNNASEEKITEQVEPATLAINNYLTDSIGNYYLKGDICVPVIDIVDSCKTSAGDTLLVWGLFRVYNFDISKDTLKLVSGGNHPGLLHLCQINGKEMKVTEFERVGDGSDYEPDVQRLFGERSDALHTIVSNESHCDSVLLSTLSKYAHQHKLAVTMMKEYGWDPIPLP